MFRVNMTAQRLREKVLIICNHNSTRSQIAEGLLKSLYEEYYEVYSAGSNPTTVIHMLLMSLLEIGVDISENRSKSLKEFDGLEFDYVVTVCGGEGQTCPYFPGGNILSKNHLKTLQKLMEMTMKNLMLSEELEMKLNCGFNTPSKHERTGRCKYYKIFEKYQSWT